MLSPVTPLREVAPVGPELRDGSFGFTTDHGHSTFGQERPELGRMNPQRLNITTSTSCSGSSGGPMRLDEARRS